jgi:site-specific DNA-cytosine methylase
VANGYSFVAVENFAGGFAAGATLAGMHLVGNRELPGGFGVPMMEANREFLGGEWQTQVAEAEAWEPVRADAQLSNPPCAAFSGMTAGYATHGMDSKINDCMWKAVRYAARVRPAVFVMESVSQAFTNGKDLMRRLAEELDEKSGLAYRTTHVIQDNYSLGGVTRRKRYFLVLSQVPFGIEIPELKWLPVVGDALSDLRSLPRTWEPQPYNTPPTWWSHQLRSATGLVDGHYFEGNRHSARLHELIKGLKDAGEENPWPAGEAEEDVPRRYYEKFGSLPEAWQYENAAGLTREKQLLERGWVTGGFSQTKHWPWDKPGRVISGAGPHQVWHPDMRQITHRETARIMGFPDDWKIEPLRNDKMLHAYWGKGTSVAPAEWVCTWIRESLDGNPGSITGEPQPDGSMLIDVSKNWQLVERRLAAPPRRAMEVPPPVIVAAPAPEKAPKLKLKPAKVPALAASRTVETAETTPPSATIATPTPKPERAGKPAKSEAWRELVPANFTIRPGDEAAVREVFTGAYKAVDIKPGDRILDLGAHTGSFSVWAAQRGAGRSTLVEMVKETADVAYANTDGIDPRIFIAAAVSGAECDYADAIIGRRANPMRAYVKGTGREKPGNGSSEFLVPALGLEFLIINAKPGIIKFSLEGGEGYVITPHAAKLPGFGVHQLIGWHYTHDERLLKQAQGLHAALTEAGYHASKPAPAKSSGWGTMILYTLR